MIPPLRSAGIPLEAQYLYRCALDLKTNGRKEDALNYLKMAVSVDPRFCKAYNVMGNCLDEMGRYEEAMKKYDKVLELNPGHAEARFKRELLQKKMQYDGRIPAFPAVSSVFLGC
ncbi:tetratricopeptide repeat protein [Methanoregula sp.]|uniref:tetratricopeptide repeat protein n=1 Tax=Methanoregula sp. TaxID=2052170 RepID=UPI002C967DB8|nr:tetratricopeptide repeat protein [Methanoregula sp.]HVP96491.1 tetratricopeptide repeat protein [Methanoregula sp.]